MTAGMWLVPVSPLEIEAALWQTGVTEQPGTGQRGVQGAGRQALPAGALTTAAPLVRSHTLIRTHRRPRAAQLGLCTRTWAAAGTGSDGPAVPEAASLRAAVSLAGGKAMTTRGGHAVTERPLRKSD